MEYETMGNLIQALRKEKGLTQKQLADMLHITDKAVSKWERNVSFPDTATIPKLANILGVSAESLLKAKMIQESESAHNEELASAPTPSTSDENSNYYLYKDRAKHLLLKGLPGFLFGVVITWVLFLCSMEGSDLADLETFAIILIVSLVCGLYFSGIIYGWELINKLLSGWYITGSALVVLFAFVAKLLFALYVGWFAYPIALIYNTIRARKTKKQVRIATIVVIAILAILILSICFIVM